jgi:hypothetical protein
MALLSWLTIHWFDLLQTIGIVGGLFYTGWAQHSDAKATRVANLLKLTEQHRGLWMTLFSDPKLSRILDPEIDLARHPLTDGESRFVNMVIMHLNGAYHAIKADILTKPEGLSADIRGFFALPIPQAVWQKLRKFYDADFVAFVDATNKKSPS